MKKNYSFSDEVTQVYNETRLQNTQTLREATFIGSHINPIEFELIGARSSLGLIEAETLEIDQNKNISKELLEDMLANISDEEFEKVQSECPICFSSFDSLKSVRKDKCNHYFHYECILKWVIESDKVYCPLSRKNY